MGWIQIFRYNFSDSEEDKDLIGSDADSIEDKEYLPGSDEEDHEELVVEEVAETENDLEIADEDHENEDEELVVGEAFAEEEMAGDEADQVEQKNAILSEGKS